MCRYPSIDYLMAMPFEDGVAVIEAGIARYQEEQLEKIYFFCTPNGYNQSYKTFHMFRQSLKKTAEPVTQSAEDIMADVKKMMDGFA